MKNKKTVIAFVLVAVIAVSACAQQDGKSINSASALKEYLDSQPANSPDKPIKVSMSVNDMMIKNVAEVVKNADKYVSLDLSKSVGLTEIDYGAFVEVEALVGITIPNSVTSIGHEAFRGCFNLASVTIGNSVTSIDFGAFSFCFSLTSVTFLGTIPSNEFYDSDHIYFQSFPGDLREMFYATDRANGTPGTYTTTSPGVYPEWTKK